jgi:hypothetical protein
LRNDRFLPLRIAPMLEKIANSDDDLGIPIPH